MSDNGFDKIKNVDNLTEGNSEDNIINLIINETDNFAKYKLVFNELLPICSRLSIPIIKALFNGDMFDNKDNFAEVIKKSDLTFAFKKLLELDKTSPLYISEIITSAVKEKVLQCLIGIDDKRLLPIFIKYLNDNNFKIRISAVKGISIIGDINTLSELEKVCNDNILAVRTEAFEAIKNIKSRFVGDKI
jgi:hypothetical protein